MSLDGDQAIGERGQMDKWTNGVAAVLGCQLDEAHEIRLRMEDQFDFDWNRVTGSWVQARAREVRAMMDN